MKAKKVIFPSELKKKKGIRLQKTPVGDPYVSLFPLFLSSLLPPPCPPFRFRPPFSSVMKLQQASLSPSSLPLYPSNVLSSFFSLFLFLSLALLSLRRSTWLTYDHIGDGESIGMHQGGRSRRCRIGERQVPNCQGATHGGGRPRVWEPWRSNGETPSPATPTAISGC